MLTLIIHSLIFFREEFDKHFTPPYNPWQQRFCLAPGGDFFKSFKTGKATMVTEHIDTFAENGVQMKDGTFVEADFIIGATGLTLQQNLPFSTIQVRLKIYEGINECCL